MYWCSWVESWGIFISVFIFHLMDLLIAILFHGRLDIIGNLWPAGSEPSSRNNIIRILTWYLSDCLVEHDKLPNLLPINLATFYVYVTSIFLVLRIWLRKFSMTFMTREYMAFLFCSLSRQSGLLNKLNIYILIVNFFVR